LKKTQKGHFGIRMRMSIGKRERKMSEEEAMPATEKSRVVSKKGHSDALFTHEITAD
jgi:hypothetical protein